MKHYLSRVAAIALFTGSLAVGQTAPVMPPAMPTTIPSTARADGGNIPEVLASSTAPGGASTTTPLPTTRISMNFQNASVDAVLDHLSEAAGFIVVKDQPVDGRVTVMSRQSVTPQEAVGLLDSVLKVSGFTAIQTGRVLRITTRDKAKKANIPVFFGQDPAQIKATDELITQVIPIVAVDAVKLRQDLAPLISPDTDMTSNAASNSIIITDTSANVKRVVEIIWEMDHHQVSASDIKVITLKNADATSAAKLVTDILAPQQQQQGGFGNVPPQFAAMMRFRGGSGGGGGGGGGFNPGAANTGADESHPSRLVASADVRTNTVVLAGQADTIKLAEQILKELDADTSEQVSVFIYNLKNGQAADLEGVLNSLFGASGGGSRSNNSVNNGFGSNGGTNTLLRPGGGGVGGGGGGGSLGGGLGGTGGLGNNSNNNRGSGGGFGGTNGGGGNRTSNVPGGIATAAQQLAGQVYVVANVDTNSLLVTANSKFTERVKSIIEELDRPVPQVLIKCLIAEVTHTDADKLGVEYSVLNLRASGRGSKGGTNFNVAPQAAATGGLVASVVESDFTATLQALAETDKLDVLSRPYILGSDNQLASIIVGQLVPLITDTRVTDTGQQINSIQYYQIGIIVNVTPHINPEGLVIMDVAPQVSQISAQSVPISSTVNSPVIDTRAAQTRVAIRDGQTIVIGGLMQDQKTSVVKKVPFLGDIPGLGALFRSTSVQKTKRELLIFLTPHVASRPEYLSSMSRDEMRGTQLTPQAVTPGTFDDHMRGMNRGATQPSTQPQLWPPGTLPAIPPSAGQSNDRTDNHSGASR